MTHTKGPWTIGRNRAGYRDIDALDAEYPWQGLARVVVEMEGVSGYDDFPEGEANARLIAAAPDLLEALEMVMAEREGGSPVLFSTSDKARAAIAKAKGE